MPAKLERQGEILALSLSGLERSEFQDALAKVKSDPLRPGRRWNPDDKQWEWPYEVDIAVRISQMIQPIMSADIQGDIRNVSAKVAGELTTNLPADADLLVPWADRLYPYQRAGVDFLVRHPHSLLADDMGLGKTVQSISAVHEGWYRDLEEAPSAEARRLVIAPRAMQGTWQREIRQWADEDAVIVDGANPAKRRKQLGDPAPWVIINWEKLRTSLHDDLLEIEWLAIIADEAHRAKNRKAKQTRGLWALHAPVQLALTGTPIMNEPGELWSILKWLYPTDYKSYWRFANAYTESYEAYFGRRKTRVVTGVKNADALRFELANKMVRRVKTEVLDLPEKTKQIISVDMHPAQKKLYAEVENQLVVEIKQAVAAGEVNEDALADFNETGDVRKLALVIPNGAARVTRLRQVASSPAVLGDGEDDVSGKYDAVVETIDDNRHKPHVVFCWFKEATELVAARLRRRNLRAQALNGDTPDAEREDLVRRFQEGDLDVLVMTIATGEEDWTPAINQQAEDRLHRIGQANNVLILCYRAKGTVDTGKVGPKNRLKQAIVDAAIGS
jgi:SNF2 family DNA or RNA helicase